MNQAYFHKYRSFSSKDFAADDDFVRYVCKPNQEDITFWNGFLQYFPEKGQAIREANLLILALQPDIAKMQSGDVDTLWTLLSKNHSDIFNSSDNDTKVLRLQIKKVFWVCAISFFLLLTGIMFANYFRKDEIYVYHTGFDQVASVLLPDSSEVKLNANTTIKVWSSGFLRKKREISLIGEAHFNVKKKKSSGKFTKMLVHTNSGTVEVTGTIFNVYARRNKTKVYLREGMVKLNNLTDLPVIFLHPGDYIQYDTRDKTISKNKAAPEMIDSWTFNKVVFEKTAFIEVLNHIKEIHGIAYVLKDKSLKDKLFTGVLPANDISLLLKALEEAFDINIIEKDRTIFITIK